MVEHISSVGSNLSNARPLEFSVRNMARRVIGIIREEAENNGMGDLFLAALGAGNSLSAGRPVGLNAHGLLLEDIPDLDLPKTIGRTSLLSSHSSFVNPSDSVTGVFEILSVASSSRGSSAASSPPQTGMDRESQLKTVQRDIRPAVIQDIQELLDELDSCEQNISELAPQVIHKNEVIMTYGLPPTVHKFLLRASQKRDFTVVVVTGSANIRRQTNAALMNRSTSKKEEGDDEQELAATKTLQERGIPVIAISENDTWNFMSRANKVLLAADYVFADGSLLAAAGTMGVVRAARKHYKMIYVVAGTHTLCPLTSFDNGDLVEMGAPVSVDYSQGGIPYSSVNRGFFIPPLTILTPLGAFIEHALLMNPLTDFIPPETVNSFITNKYCSHSRT